MSKGSVTIAVHSRQYVKGEWEGSTLTFSQFLFNEPLCNEVLGIRNDFLQPGQNYNKMYGTEPRFNEILVITNTIQKRNRKIYLDITDKCQHVETLETELVTGFRRGNQEKVQNCVNIVVVA